MLNTNEKIILPNMKYKINVVTKEMTRLSGKSISRKIKVGKYRVKIDLHGYSKVVKLDWLAMIALFGINIPLVKGLDRGCIFDISFMKSGLKMPEHAFIALNSHVVTFTNPVYVDSDKKYRLIARFPGYAISKDGTIIDIRKGTIINRPQENKVDIFTYERISLYDQATSTTRSYLIHRLVAITWLENEDYFRYPIVNHKDKNRANYHVDNLEWVSYSSNARHALSTVINPLNDIGYTSKFTIKNIETNKIKHFDSMSELTRYLGINKINLRFYKLNTGKVWNSPKGNYLIKPFEDKEFVTTEFKKWVNYYYVVTYTDGRTETIYTIPALNETFTGRTSIMEYEALRKEILAKRPDVLDIVRYTNKNTFDKVEAMDITTNKTYETSNMREMEKLLGVSNSVLHSAYKTKNVNRVYLGKYVFKFNGEGEWNKDKYIYPINAQISTYYMDKEKFTSLRGLEARSGISRKVLTKLFSEENNFIINNITFRKE